MSLRFMSLALVLLLAVVVLPTASAGWVENETAIVPLSAGGWVQNEVAIVPLEGSRAYSVPALKTIWTFIYLLPIIVLSFILGRNGILLGLIVGAVGLFFMAPNSLWVSIIMILNFVALMYRGDLDS